VNVEEEEDEESGEGKTHHVFARVSKRELLTAC
jgi:hypothetical protein